MDRAEKILRAEPSITDGDRAALYDAYRIAPTAASLADHLQTFELPSDVENALIEAKGTPEPPTLPSNVVEAAIQQMQKFSPEALEAAENHPVVLKSLIDTLGG